MGNRHTRKIKKLPERVRATTIISMASAEVHFHDAHMDWLAENVPHRNDGERRLSFVPPPDIRAPQSYGLVIQLEPRVKVK